MFSDFNSYNQYYAINNNRINPNMEFDNIPNLMNGFQDRIIPLDELITLNQAIQMIVKKINNFGNDELFYRELTNSTKNEKILKIIEDIRNDDLKHNRILKEIYSNLTGQRIPIENHQMNNFENGKVEEKNIEEQLEILLFDKLDNIVKYRRIMSTMPSGDNYILMMAILTDEIKNSCKINYLIHINR